MARKRYATCACELCYVRVPKNEAFCEQVTEETGGWEGEGGGSSSSNSWTTGNYRSSNRSYSSSRTHYRHRTVWFCADCYGKLQLFRQEQERIRLEEEKLKEERRRLAREQRKPLVIFFWIVVVPLILAMCSISSYTGVK
jgi:hypothetical protein